jgi:hypothetical protein
MVQEAMHRERRTFREVVNAAIRRGLAPRAAAPAPPPYRLRPHHTRLRPGFDPRALNRLADELEDEATLARRGRR